MNDALERLRTTGEKLPTKLREEGFVCEQVIAAMALSGRAFTPYFFRTSDGREMDLVLDLGHERWAFEMKLTSSPSPHDWDRTKAIAELIGAKRRFLVTKATRATSDRHGGTGNLAWLLDELA